MDLSHICKINWTLHVLTIATFLNYANKHNTEIKEKKEWLVRNNGKSPGGS